MAETSITIPGVRYVIDTGRVREITYDGARNMSALVLGWTTKSSAEQRKVSIVGRGRVGGRGRGKGGSGRDEGKKYIYGGISPWI